mgnify:FL=1
MLELLDPASTPLFTQMDDNKLLIQNYPNPADEFTTFQFTLKKQTHLRLRLLDLAGKEVDIITSGDYSPGTHSINYKLDQRTSGTYFYQLRTIDFTEQKKIIIK